MIPNFTPDIDALLALLCERFPRCFVRHEARRHPLKIGIDKDILAAFDGAVTPGELSSALRCYVANRVYRARLKAGVPRIDLNGNPAGIVTLNARGSACSAEGRVMTVAHCPGCGEHSLLMPLHGEKGGPLRCPLCVGKWNAEHGRKRRLGRIVIRAIAAFMDAGGSKRDLHKLELSAFGIDLAGLFGSAVELDPLGYLADSANVTKGEIIELTSELLADAIKLAHPDNHPPERQELAHRTAQGLLALQPFVFPAPKPKPSLWEPDGSSTGTPAPKRPVRKAPDYPCKDCKSAIPLDYCDACRAEWKKRQREKQERENAKQRKRYRRRKSLRWQACESCGASLKISGGPGEGKRRDARFCSDACRQRAHRKAVTDKSTSTRGPLKSRDSQTGAAP